MISKIQELLFGSNRTGHLFAAAIVNLIALILSPLFPSIHIGIGIFTWELFATMDCDLMHKRKPSNIIKALWIVFWLPYCWLIGKHRSPLSHSLLMGTSVRLLYVFTLAFIPFHFALGQSFIQYFEFVLSILPSITVCAFIADVTHLLKDGYSLYGMILGK